MTATPKNTPTTDPSAGPHVGPHALRLDRARRAIAAIPADAMLVTDPTNVRYLSGFTGDSTYLLITHDDAVMLSDRRYETQLADQCPSLRHAIRPPSQGLTELTCDVIAEHALRRVAIETDHVTVPLLRSLEDAVRRPAGPGTDWLPGDGLVEGLRAIKDAGEIAIIRRAVDIAQRAYLSVIHRFTPATTELQIAHELEAVMRALGAEGVSFPPIIAAEPSGALPHYRPRRTPLGDTPTLLIDWGAVVDGYASDLTRTLVGPAATREFRDDYAAVLEAQMAAIDAIRDGVATTAVDAAARGVLARRGLADAFKHGLGHGIGLQIHEAPRIGPLPADAPSDASKPVASLRTGMVVTVEPGVYFAQKYGIRIEDDVLVTAGGCEVLSSLPKGLDDCPLFL